MNMSKNRHEAIERLRSSLTEQQIADIALVIETAETQGDYHWDDESGGSSWEDDVHETLNFLGDEFRKLK